MENNINLEALEGINIDEVVSGAEKIATETGKLITAKGISTKDVIIVGGVLIVGAGIGVGMTKLVDAKKAGKLPSPGVLSRKNKVVDVDEDELKEVKEKKSKKKSDKEEKEKDK